MNTESFKAIAGVVIKTTFYQLIMTVGIIAVLGLIVGLLNSFFDKLVGNKIGRIVCLTTGFIGVPVHEIGHAVFCLLFGHRITEIKLYQPNDAEGTLGYVNHLYNRKNLYHQIGNFFIGFGPILFGNAAIMLLMYWLVPNLFGAFRSGSGFSEILGQDVFSISALKYIIETMRGTLIIFYSYMEPGNWRWWVFVIPACSIALHMSLSMPDIKSSLAGFCFIVILFLAINTVLYFIKNGAMQTLTNYFLITGRFILNFMTISIIFSLMLLVIGVIIRVIIQIRQG